MNSGSSYVSNKERRGGGKSAGVRAVRWVKRLKDGVEIVKKMEMEMVRRRGRDKESGEMDQ